MRVWIFSDLHLKEAESPLYLSFLKALDEPEGANDHVVFAGDIFDFFIGPKFKYISKNAVFFEKLKLLQQKKVNAYYIEGNHDFQLEKLLIPLGVKKIADEVILKDPFSGKKIFIAHGDLIDQTDTGYLLLRSIFRNPFVRFLINTVPAGVIEWVGGLFSRTTDEQEKGLPVNWSPEDLKKLREKFHSFARQKVNTSNLEEKVDFVVLGHCHDFDEIAPFYYNMGYPPVHRQFLYYDSEINCIKRREFPRF